MGLGAGKGMGVYDCALCDRGFWTRYGFRMHMARVHTYRSTGHAREGMGRGHGHPLRYVWKRHGR